MLLMNACIRRVRRNHTLENEHDVMMLVHEEGTWMMWWARVEHEL